MTAMKGYEFCWLLCLATFTASQSIRSSEEEMEDVDTIWCSCDEGYQLKNMDDVECSADATWIDDDSSIYEMSSSEEQSGRTLAESTVTENKKAARFWCQEGFKLQNSGWLECTAQDGFYDSHSPKCERVKCKELPVPQHGRIEYEVTEDSLTASFLCDEKYHLVGSDQLECTDVGTWTGDVPTCKSRCYCRDIPLDALTKDGMKLTRSYHRKNYVSGGGYLPLRCSSPDHELRRKGSLQCLDGNWQYTPGHCAEISKKCHCRRLLFHLKETMSIPAIPDLRRCNTEFDSGETLYVACANPDAKSHGDPEIACSDGNWSNLDFYCFDNCRLPTVRNAVLQGFGQSWEKSKKTNTLQHEENVRITCKKDYVLTSEDGQRLRKNSVTLKCRNGELGQVPSCVGDFYSATVEKLLPSGNYQFDKVMTNVKLMVHDKGIGHVADIDKVFLGVHINGELAGVGQLNRNGDATITKSLDSVELDAEFSITHLVATYDFETKYLIWTTTGHGTSTLDEAIIRIRLVFKRHSIHPTISKFQITRLGHVHNKIVAFISGIAQPVHLESHINADAIKHFVVDIIEGPFRQIVQKVVEDTGILEED